jgi:class 3 adenylate cyclase
VSDVEDHRTPGTVITRIWRNEPGALELLVGRDRYREDLAHGPAAWTFGLSVIVLAVSLLVRSSLAGFHPAALIVLACLGMVGAPITFVLGPRWPIGVLVGLSFVVFVVIVAGVGLAGPGLGESVAVLPAAMSLTWLWFTRRWAVFFVGLTVVGYAVIVATRPGYSHAAARWIFVAGMVVTANALIGWVIVRIRRLAEDERRASAEVERLAVAEGEARMVAEVARAELEVANDKLARWTRTLEDRVEAQVNEIEGLNRLRRFLSPQVAEAVLRSAESGDDSLLRPHRRQIAVVFCDLRGFTSFASNAEPEEVVDALDSYYTVVGQLLHRHQATVGSFAGDGIMAYFNDPVPCDDPADRAVSMALDLAEPMAAFLASWSRRGFDLGYGVGIAYGYATLGTIGFEGRNDYTAVGSVVNLAARLCAEATPGEVLIDSRTHEATGIRAQRRDVNLKGFATPVATFSVMG